MDALFNPTTSSRTSREHTNDDGDDGRIVDELPLEMQPQFTVQDEQRELATLTIRELTELQSDLTGIQAITNVFSGLGLGGDTGEINVYGGESTGGPGSSPPAPLPMNDCSRLAALDQHMMTLPTQSTAAYFMATTKCPDEVSNERKLLFLQCEENNVPLAAQRLALCWQYRLDGFGEDRCFEPMTLAGAMRGEVVNMVKSGIGQLMPTTDAAGRAIIYVRLCKRDYARYSVKQEVMWLTYLLEIAVQHKSLQSRGFVVLFDISNGTGRHRTRQSQQYMQHALDGAFPIRMCSLHIVCNVNSLFTRVVFPVMKRFASKHVRLRTRFHRGSGEDILRSLAEFNLPRDRLPSDIGGSVLLDINQFLIDRFQLEASRAGKNLQSVEEQSSPGGQSNRAGTTLSPAASTRNRHGQAPQSDGPYAGGAAVAAASGDTKGSAKRKGPRNVVDPRMAKAVRAKQDDPDLSLHDALIYGGFAISQKGSGTTDYDFFDENDVSLKQRKNNLSRRLRKDRRKDKERASEPVDDGTTPATQKLRTRNVRDLRMAKAVQSKQEEPNLSLYDALTVGGYAFPRKGPGQTDFDVFDADGVSLKQRKNNLCTRLKRTQAKNGTERASGPVGDDGTTFANQSQASARMSRRDSFDEVIEGLPGLDELEEEDLDIASLIYLDGDKTKHDLVEHT